MNRQRDRLADASVRKTDICCEHAVCQPRERLVRGICVDGAQAPHVPCIERLQQVERFRAAYFAHENSIRAMSERRPEQVGNRHRRQRCFLAQRDLCAARLEANQVWFVDQYFRRFLDEHDPVRRWNVRRQSIQQRRLAG